MRYLLLSSCVLLFAGCASVYKNLRPAAGNISNIERFRPDFANALYKAEIDVVGRHLSGLLLIKTLPDSSTRVVFSNEVGFKFFDFGFKPDGEFNVYYIINQMDKKPVIKTLRKDFELVMLRNNDTAHAYLRKNDSSMYYIFPKPKGTYCYITNLDGTELTTMEICSPHKPIVQAIMKNNANGIPDTIGITHKNFSFTIALKKIVR